MRVIDLIRRLRDEFTSLPGLRLTEWQVERLFTVDGPTSASALHALVSAGFLRPLADGGYGRSDVAMDAASGPPVRGSARTLPSPWRRILCLVDLEDEGGHALTSAARSALRYATTLAVTHRARVTALQVVAPPWTEPAPAPESDELKQSVAGERFRGLIDVQVATGAPDEEVLRVAKDIGADLIVVGRSERPDGGSWSRLPEMLRQALCPVLIVHPSGRAAVA
jgi:nucleotide-binding universal stress UspA family protein